MKLINDLYFRVGACLCEMSTRLRAWWCGLINPRWLVVQETVVADGWKPFSKFRVLSVAQMAKEGNAETETTEEGVYYITRRVVGKYSSYGDAAQSYIRRTL